MSEFKLKRIDFILFYFVVVDILFLPYNPIIATSNSQLFILLWFVFRKGYLQVLNKTEIRFFSIFSFMVLLGTVISLITVSDKNFVEGISENIKRGLQIVFGILYYLFFYIIFSCKDYNSFLKKTVIYFMGYVTLWAILYFYDIELFLVLKRVFNRYDSFITMFENNDNFYRFSFIWADPNNISYAIVGCYVFLLSYYKFKIQSVVLLTSIVGFICIMTQSTGSWLAFGLFGGYALLVFFYKELRYRMTIYNFSCYVLLFLTLLYFGIGYVDSLLSDDLVLQSVERVSSNDSSSRFEIWSRLLEDKMDYIWFYFFSGTGYQVYVKDRVFNVHNGHFLLFLAYGFIGYWTYIKMFFLKPFYVRWSKYFFIMPFLLCFTINTLIGELKLVVLFYLLVSFMKVNELYNIKINRYEK